ncbi:MAG TPA: DUF1566 domain-containing protein [Agitococcus sp.]|nr:DUF1566 domain-containing protein [Agitococcus sp.]
MKKKILLSCFVLLFGCGESNDKDTQTLSLSGQIATQPQRLIVGQEAEFKFFGTNLPPTNLWGVTVSDCEQLKIKNNINASDSLVFSCIPKSLGKKDILLTSGSYSFNYLQQIEVFCPDQHISVLNICVSPNNVNNLWQVKNPSKSSGLFVKASLNPSAMVGQGVMYSIEWGDGISDAYRFSSNSYEETTHQYESAGTYTVSLRLYGDDNKNIFIDKKMFKINKVGRIMVSNYQPSVFERIKIWVDGVFDDVAKIVWEEGGVVLKEYQTSYSAIGKKPIKAELFNANQEKIGELSTQLHVGCSLGQKLQDNNCIDNPLEKVDINPKVITELVKTKLTVTATSLPNSAILDINGAVCSTPIGRTATSFSQWCVFSNVGQVVAAVKYAPNINFGKIEVPLTVNIKLVTYKPLNDTGLTKCSDSNAFFDCSSLTSNWLNLNQDAQHGRDVLASQGQLSKVGGGDAGFDFTKISATGQKLPANASQWSCVLDNNTGLLWENKTDDNGLHDFDNIYSYYNSDFTSNLGVLGFLNDGKNSENFVLAVNQEKLCGYSDWRLPLAGELLGIVDFGKNYTVPIDTDYFPNTQGTRYLTQSISYKNYAPLVINFSNQNASYAANQEHFVRLVRGGQ